MKIGGLQKTSLLDYPNKLSAIIWTVGCNFRCPYCYNLELLDINNSGAIKEEEIISFLKKRIGKLEALSITGGEPLLNDDIFDFIHKIQNLNYLIKIDTNGSFPDKLKKLIDEDLVDYISMDVKAPKNKYKQISGSNVKIKNIQKSIDLIKNFSKNYEFKTTIVPSLLNKDDIIEIAKWLKGANQYYLQQFKNDSKVLSDKLNKIKPYPKEYLFDIIHEIKPYFNKCEIRGESI